MSLVIDYLKSCYINKFTLAGYISTLAIPISKMYGNDITDAIAVCIPTVLLAMTSFGLETFGVYTRGKSIVKNKKQIAQRYYDVCSKKYCSRCAIDKIVDEYNLNIEKNTNESLF
jgi:uncharacterized membrane protein YfbV (UPF0208 family)